MQNQHVPAGLVARRRRTLWRQKRAKRLHLSISSSICPFQSRAAGVCLIRRIFTHEVAGPFARATRVRLTQHGSYASAAYLPTQQRWEARDDLNGMGRGRESGEKQKKEEFSGSRFYTPPGNSFPQICVVSGASFPEGEKRYKSTTGHCPLVTYRSAQKYSNGVSRCFCWGPSRDARPELRVRSGSRHPFS